jgi:glycosyltransferase involved in cell wall biosynthesis
MDNPTISVIIRNRNEEQHIGFAIQSVLDNFKNPEIIVVDNNSTDNSLEVVNLFKPQNDITIVNIDNYSPGASLNLGVKNCTSKYVLILSAHAQITTVNMEMLNNWFTDDYVAVFGNQTPVYKGKKITKRYIWSHFTNSTEENLYSKIEDRQFLHNAFCFYTRKVLEKYPFDETLPGKEDRYWAIDRVKEGHKYMYDGFYQKCNHFWTPGGATWKGIG